MIVFWNRREVWFGYDLEEYKNARDTLIDNDIKYRFRVVNNASRNLTQLKYSKTYYLYVHKKDAEKAKFLFMRILK